MSDMNHLSNDTFAAKNAERIAKREREERPVYTVHIARLHEDRKTGIRRHFTKLFRGKQWDGYHLSASMSIPEWISGGHILTLNRILDGRAGCGEETGKHYIRVNGTSMTVEKGGFIEIDKEQFDRFQEGKDHLVTVIANSGGETPPSLKKIAKHD